ncbi:DotA/TraY family protein (plasmid) [Citrobacter sp. B72]|uniref:DotA/TraY family protein n=1 Tax=Citrobacter sp. B72 TaxID=2807631 RepID=UPI001959B752|nr:DotA/TraY family protein [Citrobacter sp. B72]QRQ77067.1 DotA/TraY family protein [Citrobacter sp. B72]
MNIKRIGKVVTAPIWLPLLPLTLTVRRLYRTHNNQRELISQLQGEIREKLDSRKRHTVNFETSFAESVAQAEKLAAQRGELFSLEELHAELLLKKRFILMIVYTIFITGLITVFMASILYGLLMVIAAFTMSLYAVPSQFRMWQIVNKRLSREENGSFSDFRHETRWYLDTINPRFKPATHMSLMTLLLIVTLGAPIISYAENLDDLTTAADRGTDISRQAMVTLFGQIVNNPLNGIVEDGGDSLVSQILKIFSSTLLIVGTGVGGYLVLQKTARTAHDGQYMDREQGSFWAPIRILAAFSMLTPLPNGWSLSALLMLYAAAKVGVGGANLGTDATVDAFMAGQTFVLQPVAPSTVTLAKSLFEANMCMFGINASLDAQNNSGGIVFSSDYINQSPMENGFILKSKSFTCGGATIAIDENESLLSKLGLSSKIDVTAIRNAHTEGLNEMQRSLRDGAQKFVQGVISRQQDENSNLVNAESIIQTASQIYENKVTAAIRSSNINSQLQNLTSQVADTIKSEGWFSLGSWYQTLAVANNRVGNSAAAKGSAFGLSTGQIPVTSDLYQIAISAYHAQKSVTDNTNAGILTAKSSFESNDISDASSLLSYVFNTAGQSITTSLINQSQNDSGQVNPVIAMKNLGDTLITAAEASLATYAGIKAFIAGANESLLGTVANKLGGVGAAIKAVGDTLDPYVAICLIMLIGAGISLSIYIPLMPFLIWIAACVNYLIIVGEGIFASALWAFTHLLGNGEGMGQKTMHGYIFLLNLMFRPILMVGGFLLGGGIVVIGGTLLNKSIPIAMANAQFDSLTGIVTIIGYLILYCSTAITLVSISFSLINIAPDQVINWVGGHMAAALGREMPDKAGQSVNVFASKTETGFNNGGRNSANKAGTGGSATGSPKNGIK